MSARAANTTLASQPDELLLAVLCCLGLEDRLSASRACRCLRLASCALEWRVHLDLRDEPDPDPRLRSFVEWAAGGAGARPRNVTRLSLWHQVALGEEGGIKGGERPTQRLPSRSPPDPEGHHGRPVALPCLSAIPTLAALNLAVCHPRSLAGLSKLAPLRQLRVVAPISLHSAKRSWGPRRASSHEVASRVLEGSLACLQGLVSLDVAGFLLCSGAVCDGPHLAWLRRLTQLTHLRVRALEVSDALWALPRLEHLHVEDVLERPAVPHMESKLSLGSDQLSRLTLEACSLGPGQGILASSLRELDLLRCQDFGWVSLLAPSGALSRLCFEAPHPRTESHSLRFLSGLSSLTELQVHGLAHPVRLWGIALPKLHSLTMGLRAVDHTQGANPEYICHCYTHLSRLENLTLEVPLDRGSQVPPGLLENWVPQGCHTRVVENEAIEPWDSEEEEEAEEDWEEEPRDEDSIAEEWFSDNMELFAHEFDVPEEEDDGL